MNDMKFFHLCLLSLQSFKNREIAKMQVDFSFWDILSSCATTHSMHISYCTIFLFLEHCVPYLTDQAIRVSIWCCKRSWFLRLLLKKKDMAWNLKICKKKLVSQSLNRKKLESYFFQIRHIGITYDSRQWNIWVIVKNKGDIYLVFKIPLDIILSLFLPPLFGASHEIGSMIFFYRLSAYEKCYFLRKCYIVSTYFLL